MMSMNKEMFSDFQVFLPAHADTTEEDFRNYIFSCDQIDVFEKFDESQPRDDSGRWTDAGGGSGASKPLLSDDDVSTLKSVGKQIAFGVALTGAAAAAVALAPELFALAGGAAAGEAALAAGADAAGVLSAATKAGKLAAVTSTVQGVAFGSYQTAALTAGMGALRKAGFNVEAAKAKLKPIIDLVKGASPTFHPQVAEILQHAVDETHDALSADLSQRIDGAQGPEVDRASLKTASLAGAAAAYADMSAAIAGGLGKRGATVETRAESAMATRLKASFKDIGSKFADQLRAEHAKLMGKSFSADQPRDETGKWTSGGSSSSDKTFHGPDDAKSALLNWKVSSPFKTIGDLIAASPANQDRLVAAGKQIAQATGTEFKDPGVKTAESAQRKFTAKRYNSPGDMTDLARGGFVTKTPAAADAVVEGLKQHFDVIDEGWAETPVGYFDRKVLVKFDDGQIGETQLWQPDLLQAKAEGGGHALYDAYRVLPDGDQRKVVLDAQMRHLYSAALAKADDSWATTISGKGNTSG